MNIQYKQTQGFGVVEVIIIVIVVGLVGALGWTVYTNFKDDASSNKTAVTPKEANNLGCADNETTAAINGTFCSEDIGIKFTVPSIFKGKLVKADNYEVFQGSIDQHPGVSAGTSELVFSATISGTDNFTFSIAKEPLRSGYIGLGHALQDTYFNKDTDTLKTSMDDKLVPSSTVDGVRLFNGQMGDAGLMESTYLAVVSDHIVKIKIKNSGYMGSDETNPTTIDATAVFKELDDAMKNLNIL